MAETPPHQPLPAAATAGDTDTEYWCYHCDKRVSIETVTNLPDIICFECKNGFVESIAAPPPSTTVANRNSNQEPSFSHQFLQILRLIAEAARDDDNPPPPPPNPISDSDPAPDSGDFLRIELNGWNNDEDDNDNDEDDGDEDEIVFDGVNITNENDIANEDEDEEDDEDLSIGDQPDDEEVRRRRRRALLRLRIRDFASRATTNRNRILDWSEILMGLEDHTMEFRVEMPEWDGYVGNPEDYVDAAGYEALLQNLAESDGARRGAPPASKSAISGLKTVEVTEEEGLVCAICKESVLIGEKASRLPCEHGYHGDCIVTWLGSRNTCPVCRFELPTEDPEYEEQRKKKRSFTASSAGASGSNNTSSS